MDESPLEIGMKLDFLARDVRNEFVRLFQKCLTSRSYGMEHRMDHNRDLLTLRIFMRDRLTPHFKTGFDFDVVCGWLDYSPDDARRRIARVQTWDMIRNHLEANGSAIRMPAVEAHIDALFALATEQRGPAWAQFYDASIAARVPITSSNIKAWVENYKALPVETETVGEPQDISFDEENEDDIPPLQRRRFHAEHFLQMREAGTLESVQGVQSGLQQGVAQDPSAQLPAAFKDELSSLCARLSQEGEIDPETLYRLWIREFGDAPSGLHEAAGGDVVVQMAPSQINALKPAVAVDVTPESEPLTQTPGKGPLFEHPDKVRVAIEKIALACGGDDLERRAEWRSILKDPVKIAFIDLLEWAEYGSDDIRRIASLATGNLHKGLHTAMRIIKGVIDARTTLNFLVNRCRAEGGRLEHAYGPYKIVITYHKDQDYDET